MQYTKLGYTDIEISKVCVGCMSFGGAGKVRALEVALSAEDIAALAECCLLHPIMGTPTLTRRRELCCWTGKSKIEMGLHTENCTFCVRFLYSVYGRAPRLYGILYPNHPLTCDYGGTP